MTLEMWANIPGFPAYQVSNCGSVRNAHKGHLLRPFRGYHGYLRVNLCVDGARKQLAVARLVCAAFNGEQPSADHQVAHLNGEKENNNADNLYWATISENAHDRVKHGTSANGSRVHSKLTSADVRAIRGASDKLKHIAAKYGISMTMVVNIRSGRSWRGA